MFWGAIEQLRQWERDNLPGGDTPQGSEVLIWLLKCQGLGRPLKDLYRSSRYSEPTIRAYLKTLVDGGFVEIATSGNDLRTRIARPTPLLEQKLDEYVRRFREAAALATLPAAPNFVSPAVPLALGESVAASIRAELEPAELAPAVAAPLA